MLNHPGRRCRAMLAVWLAAAALAGAAPAQAQLGDLLNKAKEATDTARQQLDGLANAAGHPAASAAAAAVPSTPSMPSAACLTRYPTKTSQVRYQNNCGSDLVRLHRVEGTCIRTDWAIGRDKSLVPYTAEPVCRGKPQAGPGPCDCAPGTRVAYADVPPEYDTPVAAAPQADATAGTARPSARERVRLRAEQQSGHQGGTNGPPGAMPACVKVQQLWDPGLRAVDPNSLYVENDCPYALYSTTRQADGTPYVCKSSGGRQPGSAFTISKSDAARRVFCDGQASASGHNACACSPDSNRFMLPQDASALPVARSVR
ncbi:MAG: hypothetical protein KGJ24_00585 [Burkholderiales bacterium]|nr:hypothetical protein [Burkholderiales bacterium]MDE2565652.1 hypothetical protein [Burkholderiales bacterium]